MDSFWDFLWLTVSVFLLMAYLVVLYQVVTDLFRDHDTGGLAKAVWVLFLIVLPLATSLVYLVARGHGMSERGASAARRAQADTEQYVRAVSAGSASPSEEISRAKSLLDGGVIDQREFEGLKAKALAL
jgi:hypothetical protein